MSLFRELFGRQRSHSASRGAQSVPLPSVTTTAVGLIGLVGTHETGPRLAALLRAHPTRWVFVELSGQFQDWQGTVSAVVTDLEGQLLGYVPVTDLRGVARALASVGTVICAATLVGGLGNTPVGLALDGDFLARRVAEAREQPTTRERA